MNASTPPPHARGPEDLQALCHRLGSPLGALVNHLALLEMDRDDLQAPARSSLDGARRATSALRRTLEAARAWSEAHGRPLSPERLEAAALEPVLGHALPAGVRLDVDPGAWAQLTADLAADGRFVSASVEGGSLTLRYEGLPERTIDAERGEGVLDPFGASGCAPRWACARILALRLGARWQYGPDDYGTPCASVSLPHA